ncbi:MAG: hypothetical protein DRN26_02865 [Thermoplasmata archaeon]|nr:MAG: hypothetical protein DRN26_02865 [Thermoplasmata archaeon]
MNNDWQIQLYAEAECLPASSIIDAIIMYEGCEMAQGVCERCDFYQTSASSFQGCKPSKDDPIWEKIDRDLEAIEKTIEELGEE